MSIHEPPGPPSTLEGLLKAGDNWAQEQATDRKEIDHQLKGLYVAGTVLWQAHRDQLLETFEEGGGVKKVHDASAFGDRGLTHVELQDGRRLYASDLILGNQVILSRGPQTTRHFGGQYDMTSSLRLAFGGGQLGGSIERDRWDIDTWRLPGGFEALLNDADYFPNLVGIEETVEVTNPRAQDGDTTLPQQFKAYSSISAQIWRSNIFTAEDMPNPYERPEEYRRWALRGLTQLNVIFAAPVLNESGRYSRTAIVGERGKMHLPTSEVVSHINRFRELLTFYAFRNHSQLFQNADPYTFGILGKIDAEIEGLN